MELMKLKLAKGRLVNFPDSSFFSYKIIYIYVHKKKENELKKEQNNNLID